MTAAGGTGAPRGRLLGIEGIRAVACTGVVLHHVWITGGRPGEETFAQAVFLNLGFGVTLFFALSGFLLYRPFAAAIARGGDLPGVREYLRNRALRILPAYWVILLVVAVVLRAADVRDADGALGVGALDEPVALLKAALLIHDYEPSTLGIGIGTAWSLAVEVVFYLLLPLLVLAAAALARDVAGRGRRVGVLLLPPLLLLLVGLSGKYVAGVVLAAPPAAGFNADWHSVVERSFWAQADLFSFGMAAAVIHTEVVDRRLVLHPRWRMPALALAAAIALVCASRTDDGQLSYLPENTVMAIAAALLVAVVAFPATGGRPTPLLRLLELRPVVAAGVASYSVFLWHDPLVAWLGERGVLQPGWGGFAINLAVTALVVGSLSALTYRWIELPALRRKRRPAVEPRSLHAAQAEAAP